MTDLPPVALFAYRRADHTQRTLKALAECPEAEKTDLVAFADGPRGPEQNAAVHDTRAVIMAAKGFRSVRMVERAQNIGLFQNVVTGLNEMFGENDRVIVLEDDIEARSDFLSFMNRALDHYETRLDVFSVTGYLYPAHFSFPADLSSFLFPRFCCWGWATWSDRWEKIDWRIPTRSSFMASRDIFRAFWKASNDLPEIMLDLIEGKNSSWSILFNYWQIRNGAFCVYPTESKALNIGFDGTGTHDGKKDKFRAPDNDLPHRVGLSTPFHFADAFDERLSRPLATYFRNSPRRKLRNLLRYGRIF